MMDLLEHLLIMLVAFLMILSPLIIVGIVLYIFLGNMYTGGKGEFFKNLNVENIAKFITRLFH